MPPSRRSLLAGLGAAALGAGLPRPARAASASPGQRRFLFLTCFGGWDPTRVLVPAFGDAAVSMEDEAAPYTVGAHTFVDHPDRPATRDVLTRWGDRFALVHGMMVPSVAHMACLQLVRTGALAGQPDWPAILASASTGGEPLPHLVLSGPSYPDALSPFVARTGSGGQLDALVDGSIAGWTGRTPPAVGADVRALEDALVAARREGAAARAASSRHLALYAGHAEAEARMQALVAAGGTVDWTSSGSFEDDALLAVELLAAGLCRCASVGHPTLWDSHSQNDVYQSVLWESTMDSLGRILDAMAVTAGPAGGSLLDETVVVLMSEMGRTPLRNDDGGKDHWPYASALLVGSGVAEGGTAGAYDPGLLGAPVDAGSGERSEAGAASGARPARCWARTTSAPRCSRWATWTRPSGRPPGTCSGRSSPEARGGQAPGPAPSTIRRTAGRGSSRQGEGSSPRVRSTETAWAAAASGPRSVARRSAGSAAAPSLARASMAGM